MNIRPIHNENDYEAALARIDALMDAKMGTPEGDELEILSTLVESYEARSYKMPPCDPVEAIRFRMEQMGLERKDLEEAIGSASRVSEVFNHKRPLTIRMIKNLYTEFSVPLESLLGVMPPKHSA